MNVKGVSVVTGVALVILAVVFLSNNSAVPPQIIDSTVVTDNSVVGVNSETEGIQIKDNATLEFETSEQDTPTISDSVLIEQSPGLYFYIDENGTKHYVMNVTDAPIIEK